MDTARLSFLASTLEIRMEASLVTKPGNCYIVGG